jgi:acetamidase/formamidase
LENEELIMAISSARPLEDATRIADRELVYCLEKEYGILRYDAYMRLSQWMMLRPQSRVERAIP